MYDHPDMKELAINLIRGIRGGTPPDESLAQSNVALAAAAIALVERLDRLISLKEADTGSGPIGDGIIRVSASDSPSTDEKPELDRDYDPAYDGSYDGWKEDIPY